MKTDKEYSWFNASGIDVAYYPNQNGGGMHFGQNYIDVIKKRYNRKFNKVYEFCCGPAYIGFSLLGSGLTKNLILSDLHLPAKYSTHETATKNNITNSVNFYLQAGVSSLPESDIDLVISNPPHFLKRVPWLRHIDPRIYIDSNWEIHKEFYSNIADKITDDGIILLQENALGSSPHDFELMANKGGLKITDIFPIENPIGKDWIYYIELRKNND